jgi:hypothetical protein
LRKIFFSPTSFLRSITQVKRASLKGNSYRFTREAYTLAFIDADLLKISGILGVILALDNTIVSEDDRYLSPGAEAWIKQV